MTNTRLLPVVAAALVDPRGRVLMQRRPPGKQHAGLWELPGGKVEPDEEPEAALARELTEELDIRVEPEAMTPVGFASVTSGERHLLLLLYKVTRWKGTPRALEADRIGWFDANDLSALPMPDADVPLVEALRRWS